MNIYLVERTDSVGYDEYDSFVCVAMDEDTARHISPDEYHVYSRELGGWVFNYHDGSSELDRYTSWTHDVSTLLVYKIGKADPMYSNGDVICSSFNAG